MSLGEIKKNAPPSEKDVTLYWSDFASGIQKFWWLSAVLAALMGTLALYVSYARYVPLYRASATYTVLIQNDTLAGNGSQSAYSFSYSRTTAQRLSAAFEYSLRSNILQKKICGDLGVDTMPAALSAEFAAGTNMMTVSALGPDGELARQALLSFAEHYGDVTVYIIGPSKLVTISEPECPQAPYNAHFWQETTIKAVLLGALLGAAWIVLYAILRQTVRSKADIRQELNQTCLGVLPLISFKRHKRRMDTRILLTNPAVGGDFMESIRLLRDAVLNALREGERALLITSTAPDEGKSVVTLNLAAILSKGEKRVIVIDADLRNSGSSGIAALLRLRRDGTAAEETALYRIQHDTALNIDVLTFDTQAHRLRQIICTEQMRMLVDSLKTQYDMILLDTPPCGMISDTAIIAGAADAAVYVVRQDTVLTSRIRTGTHTLLSSGIRLLGCVLNGAASGLNRYGYYYGSYRTGARGSSSHRQGTRRRAEKG